MPTAQEYRWADLPSDKPMPLLERRRVHGEHATIANLHLQKGLFVPEHDHPNEQIVILQSGRMKFTVGAAGSPEHRELVLTGGEVLVVPSSVPHSAEVLEDAVLFDVFSPPAEVTGIDTHGANKSAGAS